MHRLLIVMALLTCLVAGAGASGDTIQVRRLYEEARELMAFKKTVKAGKLAREGLKMLDVLADRPVELLTGLYNILGDCALEAGDYPAAIEGYERSRKILAKAGLADGLLIAEVFNKLGNYYLEIQDYEQARLMLDRALDIRTRAFGTRHLKVAEVYNNIGVYMYFTGDYDKALEFHNQALAIRLEQLESPHPQIAQSYDNIGLSLEGKNRREQALDYYQQAISIYSELDMQPALAGVYNNLSGAYGNLGYPGFLLEYQNRALKIWQENLDPNHPSIALCYTNLGNYYSAYTDDHQKAFDLHNKALTIRLHNYGEVHPDVGASYCNIGVNYSYAGAYEKAIAAFDKSMYALNYRPESDTTFDEVNDKGKLLKLFEQLVVAHYQVYIQTDDTDHWYKAYAYIKAADLLIDYLRNRYEPAGSKLQLAGTAHGIYDLAIELALGLYQLTGDKKYLQESFLFSEKSKGILLLEALRKTDAENFAGIPAEKITEIRKLEATVNRLEKRRFLEQGRMKLPAGAASDSLDFQIFEQKQAVSRMIKSFEKDYPAYYNLRYETSTVPVAWIQEHLLKPGQTILEYFLGRGRLQIFVINKDGFEVRNLEIDSRFYFWLGNMISAIRTFPSVSPESLTENINQYAESAAQLYQVLIEPVKDIIQQHLIIIPDGELGYLPFEALLSEKPEDTLNFMEYPYMIREYAVSYNYSSTLLKEMTGRKKRRKLSPYLGFAPVFREGNAKGLAALRYNQEEITGVYQLLGGRVLSGDEATKRNFLNFQSGFSILHLATHGKVDDHFGDYSYLAFSESAAAHGNDALLFVKEIYNLSTNAEMVVLSACDSGTGELQRGEGIASVARSFSYVGARSLIATQWSVDDKATKDLILRFFKQIKNGKDKDKALRDAKLDFIRSQGNTSAHPFYWASFVAVGNMDAITFGPGYRWYLAGIVAFFIAFIVYLFYRKKFKR